MAYQASYMQHLLLLATLSVALLLLSGPPTALAVPLIPNSSSIEYKRYCSNSLSDAIRLICGGRYNSLSRQFPESVGPGRDSLKSFTSDEILRRPFQTGPIHECCRRPCGYAELKMYCAPD